MALRGRPDLLVISEFDVYECLFQPCSFLGQKKRRRSGSASMKIKRLVAGDGKVETTHNDIGYSLRRTRAGPDCFTYLLSFLVPH